MHTSSAKGFTWFPHVICGFECDDHMADLLKNTPWETRIFNMYGRKIEMPRQIAFYGAHPYTYSGQTHPAAPMPALVDQIRTKLEALTNQPFNCVLLNLYRNGRDSVSWHSDDDYSCGDYPGVGSISFGATRTFKVRRKDNPRDIYQIDLKPGGLLWMYGRSQIDYEHSIPKTKRPILPRINLTFRYMAG